MLSAVTTYMPPCHPAPVVGGPARVWCQVCGASYQADAAELSPVSLAYEGLDLHPIHTATAPTVLPAA